MSRRREKEAGLAMSLACRRCMGRFDRGQWLQDLSRIKTRRTPSLPNWLLFPSNFPTRAQQTRQHSCPTRNQPVPDLPLLLLAASCCSHPSWPRCPLIRHNSTTVALSLLLSLPQAKPATWKRLAPSRPRGSSVVRQQLSCSTTSVRPKDHICHKELWHTGAPVVALITPGFKPLSCS